MAETSMLLNLGDLTFNEGLIGLPELKHFVLQQSSDMMPIALLHSKEENGLSFIVADPNSWFPEYKFDISDEEMAAIKAADVKDLTVLVIINVSSDPFQVTANMISPLVINVQSKLGIQLVLERSPYMARHPLTLKTMSVTLKEGLLGIPEWKNFVLQIVDEFMPVMLLASQDARMVSFPVTDPWLIDPAYNPQLSEEDKAYLSSENEKELAWFVILNVQSDPLQVTANMMAPIAMNPRLNLARQVLLAKSGYPTTRPIKMIDPNTIMAISK
ncbi:MAG: flagellar assembly protein FliW [Anaerolineae bacterium]|nr:flagellar assembly protein FliW [Anaerolineae bacterium]